MFFGSSGGGFLSTCGLADGSAEVLAAAGLCPVAGGGLCSVEGLAGSRAVGGFAASLATGDLSGSVWANKLPAASKPVSRRQIGFSIRHETAERRGCPIVVAAGVLTRRKHFRVSRR